MGFVNLSQTLFFLRVAYDAMKFAISFCFMAKSSPIMLWAKALVFCLGVILQSCCPFFKEDYLGDNFILSEYDNVDRRILYSKERCSGSGQEIVPMTVLEYAFNDKWIIAKTGDRFEQNLEYWVVNKHLNLRHMADTSSNQSIAASRLNGPFDSIAFVQKLRENAINLKLKKI